jgi:hypothetical protein
MAATSRNIESHLGHESTDDDKMPRLSKVLFDRREASFSSIAALPSNVQAIEAGLMFAAGLTPFVALVGPSGWGKSHLLKAIAYRMGNDLAPAPVPITVTDYLANVSRAEAPGPLILDDVQEIMKKSRLKLELTLNLQRRVRGGRPTILAFTSPKPSRALRALLPSPREWCIETMGAAEPAERVLLLHQMSGVEGLTLSPRLSKVIADQMYGNGRTIAGALKRLRLSGPHWLDSSATLRAFGLLDPFFADNGTWDLKHKILRQAEHARDLFPGVSTTDLALYTLMHEAGLSEVDVAHTVGIEPADAYLRATSFRNRVQQDAVLRISLRHFIDSVIDLVAKD